MNEWDHQEQMTPSGFHDAGGWTVNGNPAVSKWHPIDTAPRDGTHFLAWGVLIVDEYDEDDRLVAKGKREECAYIAYGFEPFPGFMEFPFRGSKPVNLTFTHWMPLPAGPCKINA
jgi:hypothetical protein